MKLTYKQVKEALYQIYLKEFSEKGKQPLAHYDCLNDVPMPVMTYLLNNVGNTDIIEINTTEINLESLNTDTNDYEIN